MATKNYNIRFRNGKADEDRAWEHLHSEEVRHSFRSQNGFVIAAINDFYDSHLCITKDPYLESSAHIVKLNSADMILKENERLKAETYAAKTEAWKVKNTYADKLEELEASIKAADEQKKQAESAP